MEWSRISEVARLTQWSPDGCEANGLPTRPHRLLTWQVFWEWTSQTRLVGLVCLLSTLRLYSCPRHQTWAPRSPIYTYVHICVCVLRMDTGRSRKGCKAWRRLTLSKLLYRRRIRTCPVFSGRRECTWLLGQRASKDVPAESNTGNWVNSRNARCSKLGFERIIGMMKRISEKN